jgi:hypothetical protein
VSLCYQVDFHPPDDVRVFAVPVDAIRRWDSIAFVLDVRIGELMLRHYAFAEHWFAVNCTLDLDGRFVVEHASFDFTFNCDIITPAFNIGRNVYGVDLALDVLVGPDGRTHRVIDEDDFEEACAQGWLTAEEQRGARQGLEDLLGIIDGEGLVPFLDRVVPFADVRPRMLPPMVKRHPADVPILAPTTRGQHFGRLTPMECGAYAQR